MFGWYASSIGFLKYLLRFGCSCREDKENGEATPLGTTGLEDCEEQLETSWRGKDLNRKDLPILPKDLPMSTRTYFMTKAPQKAKDCEDILHDKATPHVLLIKDRDDKEDGGATPLRQQSQRL